MEVIALSDPPFEVETVSAVCGVPDEERLLAEDYADLREVFGGREISDEEYKERHPALRAYKKEELIFCNKCSNIHGIGTCPD